MRKLRRIFVHTSATSPTWMNDATLDAKIAEIRRWHVEDNGWSDIGYHYIIDRNGAVGQGRPVSQIGAHVGGHNHDSIGICLIGGRGGNENDEFFDHYTKDQDMALRILLADLQNEHGTMSIHGHNEVAAKACPCFQVKRWLKKKPAVKMPKETVAETGLAGSVAGSVAAASGAAWQVSGEEGMMYAAVAGALVALVFLVMYFRNQR